MSGKLEKIRIPDDIDYKSIQHISIETRDKLEKHWNNKINFTVLLYDNIPIKNKKMLREKLEANNFTVIDTSDLTKEDLNSEKYLMQDNLHPTEAAWDLLTPKIIKTLGL